MTGKQKKTMIVISIVLVILFCYLGLKKYTPAYLKTEFVKDYDNNERSNFVMLSKGLLEFSKTGLWFYQKNDVPLWSETIRMKVPQWQKNKNKVLIFDQNGNEACVVSESGIQYRLTFDQSILLGTLSPQGDSAFVLSGKNEYILRLIDREGNRLADKICKSMENLPIALAFSDQADRLAVSFIDASSLEVASKVSIYDLTEKENLLQQVSIGLLRENSMIVSLQFVQEDVLLAQSENEVFSYLLKEEKEGFSLPITAKLQFFCFVNHNFVLALSEGYVKDDEMNHSLRFYNTQGKLLASIPLTEEIEFFKVSQGHVFTTRQHMLTVYDEQGKLIHEYFINRDFYDLEYYAKPNALIISDKSKSMVEMIN